MNTSAIKERLHEYIERVDDKYLEAIYLLLEKELSSSSKYDESTLETLYQRRENHLKGQSQSYTVDETIQSIRSNSINK